MLLILAGCTSPTPEWELANPIEPVPRPPLGVTHTFDELEDPPTPRLCASANGSSEITGVESELGAFKTPTVREVTKRAPYMHDGSVATLREVVELYNRGGEANPHLDPKIQPLNLSDEEIDALVAMMEALEGEGYMDTPPTTFPQ